ncbi:BsuPI-related putative proteinase inhibitor [Oceanospirillum sediminis]|uniref:Intracellular proteinase inhibitor BsuPI domain-containing protein n=1 Tax=Oceanospirillum sediminis TaxID=2760088 RepID=A0A839INS8_9GAMM|nr:BsuPI-related putative proteinase inhibitor [Oceanospirillum sediminis]MBB1486344.1 hypothetical protein [Oceanospirillum sediminis]
MMHRIKAILLFMVVILSGCLGRTDSDTTVRMTLPEQKVVTPDKVEIQFVIRDRFGQPNEIFLRGEPVTFDYQITNNGTQDLKYQLTHPAHDISITQSDKLIWSPFHDMVFLQVVISGVLKSGERLDFTKVWNGLDLEGNQVQPGQYLVQPSLTIFIQDGMLAEPEAQSLWIN